MFDGWFTQAQGGERITAETVSVYLEDFTLYAHWIQIDADYARVEEAVAKIPADLSIYTEDSVAALTAAVDAVVYDLDAGQQKQVDKWANEINKAIQNLKGKSVTVTFAYNGGTRGLVSRKVRYGETYGTLPVTTKEGYEFAGWYTANVGGEKVESSTVMYLLEDHKLYARWIGTPADYSAVEAAIQRIPEDLSIYTQASVQALEAAVDAVEWELYVEHQAKIDAWAQNINASIDGLVHEHNYTSDVTEEPGCVETGIETLTCICGDSYTQVIPATGHTETDVAGKAPTCTESGLTAGKKCGICGVELAAQETLDAAGHRWDDGEIIDQPTCSEDGTRKHTCENCGDSYTELIEATGSHVYEETVVMAPTCTDSGTVELACGCGYSYTQAVAPLGHNYVNGLCGRCKETDPQHLHSYTATVTEEPGCVETGVETLSCVCGDSYTQVIPATGHTETDVAAKAPACTEPGLTAGKLCAVCETVTVKQETVPAAGHSYENGVCVRCGAEDPDLQVTEPSIEPGQETTAPTEPVFKAADYSDVDAAIGCIPEDLSQYTDETVQKLNGAVSAVRRDLDESKQAQVDDWAQAIYDAVEGLWFRPAAVTTAKPEITVEEEKAAVDISGEFGEQVVKEAVQRESQEIVIPVAVEEEVTKAEISLSSAVVEKISENTEVTLTVSTPVANVSIPEQALNELAEAGSGIVVTAEKTDTQVKLEMSSGEKTMETVSGGLIISIPHEDCTPGTVAVLVHDDGSREVIRKSVADEGKLLVTVPVDGSATLEIVDNAKMFEDVTNTDWHADAVAFASGHQLFQGVGETTFEPNSNTTRAMLAVVLYRLENELDHSIEGMFQDVEDDSWYEKGVYWAADMGIVQGYGDGTYGPDDEITREQLVTMLWRYVGSPASSHSIAHFTDADAVSGYAEEAIRWANENKILNGMGDGTLNPRGNATRAQVAQILMNFMMNLYE